MGRSGADTTPKPAAPFTTPLTVAEMTAKQAVVDTSAGTFVIDLRPDLAPNHVGYFIKLARSGAYDGTIFHRIVRLGIIQGGDPLSKEPAKAKAYGTGGQIRGADHSCGVTMALEDALRKPTDHGKPIGTRIDQDEFVHGGKPGLEASDAIDELGRICGPTTDDGQSHRATPGAGAAVCFIP